MKNTFAACTALLLIRSKRLHYKIFILLCAEDKTEDGLI